MCWYQIPVEGMLTHGPCGFAWLSSRTCRLKLRFCRHHTAAPFLASVFLFPEFLLLLDAPSLCSVCAFFSLA